jgi:hypothetical protein|tara:strand:+ start:448 stop:588 length:141 start_codon:yes stop_codon:yes gene_type:complete
MDEFVSMHIPAHVPPSNLHHCSDVATVVALIATCVALQFFALSSNE